MPSPFPGMNPYLEQEDVRHDFHERFIPLVATILGGQLRPRYIVKIDEHIYERVSFVEIRDRRDRELVTVVELLRPANKHPGPDREQYLAKRMALLSGPVHLVEIDLLRGALPCRRTVGPSAPTQCWSAALSAVAMPSSGQSRSESDCPWSPYRSVRLIPTPSSTCKRCWTRFTTTRAMSTTSTRKLPGPGWRKKTRTGRISFYHRRRCEKAQ